LNSTEHVIRIVLLLYLCRTAAKLFEREHREVGERMAKSSPPSVTRSVTRRGLKVLVRAHGTARSRRNYCRKDYPKIDRLKGNKHRDRQMSGRDD
jgi:hypothetical protein